MPLQALPAEAVQQVRPYRQKAYAVWVFRAGRLPVAKAHHVRQGLHAVWLQAVLPVRWQVPSFRQVQVRACLREAGERLLPRWQYGALEATPPTPFLSLSVPRFAPMPTVLHAVAVRCLISFEGLPVAGFVSTICQLIPVHVPFVSSTFGGCRWVIVIPAKVD